VWGYLAKVNIPIDKKRKIEPKTIDCVFVGYFLHNTTYRFLVVNSEVFKISNSTIMESRDATFFENKLSKPICDTSYSNLSSCNNANMDIVLEPRRSKRSKKVKDFGSEFCSYGESMRSIDAPFWKKAIDKKMSSLKTNQTRFLTDLSLIVKV